MSIYSVLRANLCVNRSSPSGKAHSAIAGWHCVALLLCLLVLTGCNNGMEDQPKYEPFEASTFFDSGMSAQPLVANTVARGQLRADSHLYAGQVAGRPAEEFPFPVTAEIVARGQERYNIYCTPCHGYAGYGDGVIVQRGFSPPPSFHDERLRAATVGHFYSVITNGFGTMYSYADRITPEDRWAIIAYVRALQLSQNATMDDVPADEQPALEAASDEITGTVTVTVVMPNND
ncbi:MAG: cytochrome c [Caldilineaceae bacterium]|nr:cytochrome c [Caldilineaceae bacterium]